jgi:soluble lytic murein transglycosylase
MGAPEPALVLAITRQESGFDPMVRSGVGARGMMQLMPATAQIVARRNGMDYSPSMLDEPDYNMRLGSSFLGQLVSQFSGSYVMAVAGYNAGPGRPTAWSNYCGDPRGATTDPIDFIECIPFSETRNYVMRVLEGMQVYRAKLNGGSAPVTLSADLARGGYAYPASVATSTIGTAAGS